MNALNAVIVSAVFAVPAFAQSFTFDAVTGCSGLNAGVRGVCGDLRGADLSGADLSRLDLRGARLDGAKLVGASLQGANLAGASLENADLSRAVLTGAKLMKASYWVVGTGAATGGRVTDWSAGALTRSE